MARQSTETPVLDLLGTMTEASIEASGSMSERLCWCASPR
jgi:hypothetical protein